MKKEWQEHPITKRYDNTFIISHTFQSQEYQYQVCPLEVDPSNAYDISEVSAFWDSLPDDDPRKQYEPEPPPPPPPLPEESRQMAYNSEADDLLRQAQFYEAEAKGFRLLGDDEAANEATAKSESFYKEYAKKKQEIREQHPDEEIREQHPDDEDQEQNPAPDQPEETP